MCVLEHEITGVTVYALLCGRRSLICTRKNPRSFCLQGTQARAGGGGGGGGGYCQSSWCVAYMCHCIPKASNKWHFKGLPMPETTQMLVVYSSVVHTEAKLG